MSFRLPLRNTGSFDEVVMYLNSQRYHAKAVQVDNNPVVNLCI